MQPGMQTQMQPQMQVPMQPEMQPEMQPQMQMPMQPGMQPGMQPQMQPQMQVPMQPEMQPEMQPQMQVPMQPQMQMPMQHHMQVPMRQRLMTQIPVGMQVPMMTHNGMFQMYYPMMPAMGGNNLAGGQYQAFPQVQADIASDRRSSSRGRSEESGSSQHETGESSSETESGLQENAAPPAEGGSSQEDRAEPPAEAEARMQEHVEPPGESDNSQEDTAERPVEAEAGMQEHVEPPEESDNFQDGTAERPIEVEAGNMERHVEAWAPREVELHRSWLDGDLDIVLDIDVDPPEPVDFQLNSERHSNVPSEREAPDSPMENGVATVMDNERPDMNTTPIPRMGNDPHEELHTPPDQPRQLDATQNAEEDDGRAESPATRRRRVSSDFENALVSDVEYDMPLPMQEEDEPLQEPPQRTAPVQADVAPEMKSSGSGRPSRRTSPVDPEMGAEPAQRRPSRRSRTTTPRQPTRNVQPTEAQPVGGLRIEDGAQRHDGPGRRGGKTPKRPLVIPLVPTRAPSSGTATVAPVPLQAPLAPMLPVEPVPPVAPEAPAAREAPVDHEAPAPREVPMRRGRGRRRPPPVRNPPSEDESEDDDIATLRQSLSGLDAESLGILMKMYGCAQRRDNRIDYFLEKVFAKIARNAPNYLAFVQMLIDKLKVRGEDRELFWKPPIPPVMKETIPVRVMYRLVALHQKRVDLLTPVPNRKRFLVATFITVDGNLPIGALCVDGRDVAPLRYGGNSNFYIIKPNPEKEKIRVMMPFIPTPDKTWFVLQHLEMKPDLVIHRECRGHMENPDDGEVVAKTPKCLPDCSFPLTDVIISLKAKGSAECPRCGANVILSELILRVREVIHVPLAVGQEANAERREQRVRELREWERARLRMRQSLARRLALPNKSSNYNETSSTHDAAAGRSTACW